MASRKQRRAERRARTATHARIRDHIPLSNRNMSDNLDLAMLTCVFDEVALRISEKYEVRFCDEKRPKIKVNRHNNSFLTVYRELDHIHLETAEPNQALQQFELSDPRSIDKCIAAVFALCLISPK